MSEVTMVVSSPARSDEALYADLKRRIKAAGLFRQAYLKYALHAVGCVILLAVGIGILATSPPWYVWLPEALLLAGVLTHVAYFAHDAGHRQLFKSPRLNDVVLLILDPIVGLSPSWWMDAHNAHHNNPNDVERDPNYRVTILSFAKSQLAKKPSWLRFILRFQAWYYVPIIMWETTAMRIVSMSFLTSKGRYRLVEAAGLALYMVSHFGFLVIFLGVGNAIIFSLVHQTMLGLYLGAVFAPNHKGMRVIEPGEKVSFLERQITTARNVRPGWFTDFMTGGLNFQIEHHLFPNIPRYLLGEVAPFVRELCCENGYTYYETSLLESYKEIFRFLDTAGKEKVPTLTVNIPKAVVA